MKMQIMLVLVSLLGVCPGATGADSFWKAAGTGLRIREFPSLEAKVLEKLSNNEPLQLISQSTFSMLIDGKVSPWYQVKTPRNNTGWAFGAYISGPHPLSNHSTLTAKKIENYVNDLRIVNAAVPHWVVESADFEFQLENVSVLDYEWGTFGRGPDGAILVLLTARTRIVYFTADHRRAVKFTHGKETVDCTVVGFLDGATGAFEKLSVAEMGPKVTLQIVSVDKRRPPIIFVEGTCNNCQESVDLQVFTYLDRGGKYAFPGGIYESSYKRLATWENGGYRQWGTCRTTIDVGEWRPEGQRDLFLTTTYQITGPAPAGDDLKYYKERKRLFDGNFQRIREWEDGKLVYAWDESDPKIAEMCSTAKESGDIVLALAKHLSDINRYVGNEANHLVSAEFEKEAVQPVRVRQLSNAITNEDLPEESRETLVNILNHYLEKPSHHDLTVEELASAFKMAKAKGGSYRRLLEHLLALSGYRPATSLIIASIDQKLNEPNGSRNGEIFYEQLLDLQKLSRVAEPGPSLSSEERQVLLSLRELNLSVLFCEDSVSLSEIIDGIEGVRALGGDR